MVSEGGRTKDRWPGAKEEKVFSAWPLRKFPLPGSGASGQRGKSVPREGAQAPAGSAGDEMLMGMMKGRICRRGERSAC